MNSLKRSLFITALLIAATACSPGEHIASEYDQASIYSAICDSQLKVSFQSTYYPFLVQNCASCHSTAHGSSDVNIAFKAFMERGTTLIDYQATHAHGGNNLNAADTQPMIDGFKTQWVNAQSEYLQCLVKNSGGDSGLKFALTQKSIPNLMGTATNNNWIPVEWDLESESASAGGNGRFKAIFRIEARLHVVSAVPAGINFRNPTLRLKTGSQNVEIKAISIQIDGDEQNLVTTYGGVSAIVNATTNTPLVSNSGAALAYFPLVNAATKVSFLFEHIKNTTQNPTTPGPGPVVPVIPFPIPEVPIPPGGAKFSELISGSSPYRVFARSCTGCHNDNNMSGGLNLTNYDAAKLKTAEIQNRMNNAASPMPPSGLLRQNDRDMVKSWIDAGAPN